jgi:hypothetical protein
LVGLTSISTDGNIMHSNSTFINNLNLAIDRVVTITSYNTTNLKASWNIFSIPSSTAYASLISTLSSPMNLILSNFYTVLYNASRNSLLQMLSIDAYFMVSLISQGNSVITMILGLTIAFCVLAFIICFWFIPYLFGIETTDLKALEFAL